MDKFIFRSVAMFVCFIFAATALGHGFDIATNSLTNPTVLSVTSAQPVLDLAEPVPASAPYPTAGPANLFMDAFEGDQNADGSYGTVEGFAAAAGPFPQNFTATFNILSPLYFSDGTAAAVPASTNTYLDIYDLYAGNSDGHHQGAAFDDVNIYGNTSFQTGFGVSLAEPHELQKNIYIADPNETYGEYGFAFDVLIHFGSNGLTLDTGPLFEVFALDITTDPENPGGFATFATFDQQDAATSAIVAALVPEPSTFLLALMGGGLLIAHRQRQKANRS